MRVSVRTAAVAVVAAAACLTTTVPAIADMTTVRDGAGDVWESRVDLASGDMSIHRSDMQRNVDVRNVKIAHSARKLKFWVRYVDTRRNDDLMGIDFLLRTPERRMLSMSMVVDRKTDSVLMRRNGKQVKCTGLRAEMQYPQDEFELDIPRRCLGRPTWVKVAGVTSKIDLGQLEEALTSDVLPDSVSAYGDLIGTRGYKRISWTKRLYRG